METPFRVLRARGLILQVLLAGLALVIAGRFLTGGDLRTPAPPDDSAAYAFFYLGIGIVLVARIRAAKVDVPRLFGPVPSAETMRLALVAVPLGVLSIAGFWILFLPLSFAVPDYVRRHALDGPAAFVPTTVAGWVGQVLVAVILAPPLEEVFFRGLILQRWAHRWGTGTAVVASSLLFAVCHIELFGHFLFGLAMCALYLRTRSLWLPIAAHALNNFLACVFTLPDVVHPDAANKTMTVEKLQSQWWVGLIVLVAGLVLLEVYRRRYWRSVDLRSMFRGAVPYSLG